MRKAATSRGTTGLVLEGVRVARVALVKAVRSSPWAVSGTSASKKKTRRIGRAGGGLGAAHGTGAAEHLSWPPEKLKAPQAGTGEAFGFINHKQHG